MVPKKGIKLCPGHQMMHSVEYWGRLESCMLLRSYLAVEKRQQAPCKKKKHRENSPELLVHL